VPPIKEKMPPIKKHFQIPLTHLPPIAPNYTKKCPQLNFFLQIPLIHLPPFAPNCPQL